MKKRERIFSFYKIKITLLLQRATLAEKEVTALKEQLANNSNPSAESKEVNMDRQSLESEIVAKDKEVSFIVSTEIQSVLGKFYKAELFIRFFSK